MTLKNTIKQQVTRKFIGGCIDKPLDGTEFGLQEFGAQDIGLAPKTDWIIPNDPPVKDQGNTDFCVAFETMFTAEQDTGLDLSPAFIFAATKKRYYGGNYYGFGLGIKDALGSLQNDGVCLDVLYPFNGNRNYMANWRNIPKSAWDDAATRKFDKGYFAVNLFNDKFDNFLAAAYNWQELVLTGIVWYSGFYLDNQGRLITRKTGNSAGHCISVKGSRIINGVQYAVFKNSYYNIPEFCLSREQCRELYAGYVALPISRAIAEIALKYAGKIVKGTLPEIYYIQNGQKRWFPNENMLNLYGLTLESYIEIEDSEIASIPEGEPMSEKDLKPAFIQLVKRNNLKIK